MTRETLQDCPERGCGGPAERQNMGVKRPLNRQNLLVSVGVGIGLMTIWAGFRSAETGRDAQRLPSIIESISPGPGDEVLRQSQIFVDMAEGFTAVLVVDGIELPVTRLDELTKGANVKPGSQVNIPPTAIYDPGNCTISFVPQDGAPIEQFAQGPHTAALIYWKVTDDRSKAKSFGWEFSAN